MRVLVECYHDTALVRALGVPVRSLGHEHGKGNVLLALAKWNGDAVGMVDADPGKQNSIPGEMAKYRDRESAHGLTLMGHAADARKFLVVVGPTLEDWLVARERSATCWEIFSNPRVSWTFTETYGRLRPPRWVSDTVKVKQEIGAT